MIKVLVICPNIRSGVAYYRQSLPHIYLQQHYPDFQCDLRPSITGVTDGELKDYQIVHFARKIEDVDVSIERIRKAGAAKVVLDMDDYWRLQPHHPLYFNYKYDGTIEQTEKSIRAADHITCTTSHFAGVIWGSGAADVVVLPNAIDPEQPQWKIAPTSSELIRFGWMGAAIHLEDLALLKGSMRRAHSSDIYGKYQLVLCGFDMQQHYFQWSGIKGEEPKPIKVNGEQTTYATFERILTDDYRLLKATPEYITYLRQYKQEQQNWEKDLYYRRIWTRPVDQYGIGYNDFDVALAPLNNTPFNNCKSQLKVIEAGFMKKALIASAVIPYTIDCVNEENALMVEHGRDGIDWFVKMRRLINNPSMIEDLGEALYETVKDEYHLATVTKERAELYKHISK